LDTTYLIGILAGSFTALSLLPQLIKMIREKEAGNISIAMFLVLLAGLGLWVTYGILKEDWPIIITNSVSFILNISILTLHLWYKRQGRTS
jgi:MtN3 and saliva related transmembrane protein